MFEGAPPRVYALPPGADFPAGLVAGLEARLAGAPPEAWAEVEIFVNTRRMQRRLMALFDAGPARLLPRIRLVTEIDTLVADALRPPAPALARRLALARLVAVHLRGLGGGDGAAQAFEMAESLSRLIGEMAGADLAALDVGDLSAHWEANRALIDLAMSLAADMPPEGEGRLGLAAEALAARWAAAPPAHPVIVAGSTGARAPTARLMGAVAALPQGALVLPGFDFGMPADAWAALEDAGMAEEHPQCSFLRGLGMLSLTPGDVRLWSRDAPAPDPARGQVISLALRPAPVTDRWRAEGPALPDLEAAMAGAALVEAPDPRAEAGAVAAALREAVEAGRSAALITPDRVLARRVAAALDRWRIEPDDSAGEPLARTPPGRLLMQCAFCLSARVEAAALLALLKHPLVAAGPARGRHLALTRRCERWMRRLGVAFAEPAMMHRFAADDPDAMRWAGWLAPLLEGAAGAPAEASLADWLTRHLALAEGLAAGPDGQGAGALWEHEAGREARAVFAELAEAAPAAGPLDGAGYRALIGALMAERAVTEPLTPHPRVMIWGMLESRVQGAERVILGGLNEGGWPALPAPDAWLNRAMRARLGLPAPERRIGLSAHDFEQAACAVEVIFTRARHDGEAETVPARWLSRLVHLMEGLDGRSGPAALRAMRARGRRWLEVAAALERPAARTPPAPRPAPAPPVAARPARLSVTEIQTLIRDPYAIYARHVLGLRALDPLFVSADAPLRGSVLHEVMERALRAGLPATEDEAAADLVRTAEAVLAERVPWPAARRMWRARLARIARDFAGDEIRRRASAAPLAFEAPGERALASGFVLRAKADRIDRCSDGKLIVHDYKTGQAPSRAQMQRFDLQLPLEAAIAEAGGFEGVPAAPVAAMGHLVLGTRYEAKLHPLEAGDAARVWEQFANLIAAWAAPEKGYVPRRAMNKETDDSTYDALSRHGEWAETDAPQLIGVGR